MTVTQRIEDLANDLNEQLGKRVKGSEGELSLLH